MNTLIIAVLSFVGFIVAYHTYGKWLARKIFGLDSEAKVPSQELRDDVDYIPTKKEIIFGHHFTSIAGTGPIVDLQLRSFGAGYRRCCGSFSVRCSSVLFTILVRLLSRFVIVGKVLAKLRVE